MTAEPLPPPLKIPEVSRFINRANQLRTIKPAIAYWCEYHAVNQIVTKSLHTNDDDCFAYTKALIERLEATKAERAEDEAIVDNTVGQAYVEQFAQETFGRAERVLRANKVTRQTADTFDAAATFFDLSHEWGTPDPDVLKKIKFAKWNAARILKAIREGKDPNETNPQVQDEEEHPEQIPSPTDQALLQTTSPPVVSVEDVLDAGEPMVAPVQESYFPPTMSHPEPCTSSPLSQSSEPPASDSKMRSPPAPMPHVPSSDVQAPPSQQQVPPQPSPQIPTKFPSQFATSPPDPTVPAWSNTPSSSLLPSPPPPSAPTPKYVPPPVAQAPTPGFPAPSAATGLTPSHKSIEQAQKHAKWAISALNFEDVPTAVQELRNALAMLGAQ
ncbi:hypothetical protein NOR_05795 [Metarhizium rileyi]|uniref:Vacuolar protein sorting-associated protein VTA1 n=1 Tax=Metarhizium rileyi (strain RCEF 4871) TaxID=1649241 RepID=A0A167C2P2_METRR|nr:hypothetical protein NOR_05795 [Metarhizium rileyi RCEF 4871]TWU70653.1 hypothetical protein ED733_001209 [Metarhizium rileyi]